MKHFLFLVCLCCATSAIGQPYLNETSRWKQYYRYSVYPPGIAFEEDIWIQLDGDTVVGNKTYYRVLKTGIGITYYPQEGDTTFHGAIHQYLDPVREEGNAFYAYNRMAQEEYLLYDFSAAVGDTLKSGTCKRDTVIAIDTLYLGDVPRKQFHLPSPFSGDISTLVEGVGSTFGFYWQPCNVVPTPFIKLQCFSQDGEFISFDSNFDCSALVLGIDMIKKDDFTCYPNPFSTEIFIETPHPVGQEYTIIITNLVGSIIYEKKYSAMESFERIDLSHIPSGLFILSLYQSGKFSSKKIVKS